MKRTAIILVFLLAISLLSGCGREAPQAQVAATTLPVYEFSQWICDGTGISVTLLVTESVSCLHDYSLNVRQVRAVEAADVIVLSGAGLEEFMEDLLDGKQTIDSSVGVPLAECETEDAHDHDHDHDHHHEVDSHIWLSPANAKIMAINICEGLSRLYPQYTKIFESNLDGLLWELDNLQLYGEAKLADLSCREIITFHDGFGYFAEAYGLTILKAVEEESGAEASAQELKELITLVREHRLPAIFIETNGSDAAARTIAADTGAGVYTLDMAMSGDGYFHSMYRNIDVIKEALE